MMKKSFQYSDALTVFLGIVFFIFTISSTPVSAWTPGQPLAIPFPRLGMWWPNPWEQSLDDIARYDYVLLTDEQKDFVTPLRSRNPDIILLNSTNACELSYDWPDSADYAEILKMPPEWFLTQVGSTLTQSVNATETTFHVAELTVSDGSTTYPLFVVDDTVLVDGESVVVTAVNTAAKTLTVQRGFVRLAGPHGTGTRIAAHITFWPGSWLMNMSMMSPTGVADSEVGPERWADYHARRGVRLLSYSGWDGLLIDRADPDQSWLIGGSTARTIDPDQSNTLMTDYSAFDASWNEGLHHYESNIRQEIGNQKLIYVNWGMDNYDLLNGNNYEGFPQPDGASYRGGWQGTVFGPIPNIGGYLEWLANARQPNLTTIETYEDDSGPPPDDISYDNPCVKPGFVPNYRKMRFGLTTALLGDGFFSYEINTNGHGHLCLMWFDEYDNAGGERGYLGQPLGPAYRISDISLGPDLLNGGSFESLDDLAQWGLWAETGSGSAATKILDTTTAVSGISSARIDVTRASGTDWHISFSFEPLTIISGKDYTLSFQAKAGQARDISAWVQQRVDPWENYLDFGATSLSTDWHHYEITANASNADSAAGFHFGLGQAIGSVWLDDVQLNLGNRNVWRRNYENGIVLVNSTKTAHTIDLGGTFQKIDGSQVPAINDGSQVTQVDLPSQDGIILLRPEGPGDGLPPRRPEAFRRVVK